METVLCQITFPQSRLSDDQPSENMAAKYSQGRIESFCQPHTWMEKCCKTAKFNL